MRHGLGMDGLDDALRGHEEDIAATITDSMREGGKALLDDVRAETYAALGHRLPKSWRLKIFPSAGNSIDASAYIWSRASKIIDAFDRGVTIRSRNGLWLAIPTEAAGKRAPTANAAPFGRRGPTARVTPGGFERRTGLKLRFIYRRGQPSLLVIDGGQLDRRGRASEYRGRGRGAKLYGPAGRTIVVFILVPQVRLNKRLNLDALAERYGAVIPNLYSKNWR